MSTLIDRLARASANAGEAPPFSDQTLVEVRSGRAHVLAADDNGAAVILGDALEVVVAPDARGRGIGSALVKEALAAVPAPNLAWSHGDHPAARALAHQHRWRAVRRLLQLRTSVPASGDDTRPALPAGWQIDTFVAGTDEHDWLSLNAVAFASHPEQGRMTLEDVAAREAEPWFNAADLLLLRDTDGALAGSCWLKIEKDIGEFYAVAVRPDLQGHGLGGVLMRAGFDRLRDTGIATAALYVEGENVPALALYRRSGFTEYAVDVQYAAP